MEEKKIYLYPFEFVDANLKLFEDMAKDGWILKSLKGLRGTFVKSESQDLKYFYLPKKILKDEKAISESLISAGWIKSFENMSVGIYSIDSNREGATMTLSEENKSKIMGFSNRSLRFGPFYILIILFPVIMQLFTKGSAFNPIYELFYALNTNFLQTLTRMFMIIFTAYIIVADRLSAKKRAKIMKGELPLKRLNFLTTAVPMAVAAILIILLFLNFTQLKSEEYTISEGPYLSLHDIGVNVEPIPVENENQGYFSVAYRRKKASSPLSTYFNAYQIYKDEPEGKDYSVSSDVYVMGNESSKQMMIYTLLYKGDSAVNSWKSVKLDGYDSFFVGDKSYAIFSRCNTVWKLKIVNSDYSDSVENNVVYALENGLLDMEEIENRK